MSENKRFSDLWCSETGEIGLTDNGTDLRFYSHEFEDFLNELNDEKEWLEMNNKDLVSFIKSKGYTLKDFLKYVGQFSSVGVNKEDLE